MKRLLLILAIMIVLNCGLPLPAAAQENSQGITVLLDGLPVTFDVQPVIINGSTLVPFRSIAEALNVHVTWDASTQTVGAYAGENSIRLQIGNKIVLHNEKPLQLEVSPVILNGRTLIPLRFFSESFGCQVKWIAATHSVEIISPPTKMKVLGFYALGDPKKGTSSWSDLFENDFPETGKGNTDVVSEIALGWYTLDEKGNLLTNSNSGWKKPAGWEKVLEAAESFDLKTQMVVYMTNSPVYNFLSNEKGMKNAVNNIIEEAKQYGGVNLDPSCPQ
ncbi:MAG: copper amine oxidase domain protein [Clostridiales bacterium]|jgi:hypothetical protein|nr:copper amine oxidase domain protein [Clostridiales bacterium]